MRFIVDENLPLALAGWLSDRGLEAAHTNALGLNATPDLDIARLAGERGAVVVTKDSDFLTLASGADAPQVVLVKIGNRSTAELLSLWAEAWANVAAQLDGGARVVRVVREPVSRS